MVHVTWPRWLPCPCILKQFQNLLLWNRKAGELELEMGHRVLEYYQIYSSDAPGLILIYFTARSNFGPYAFVCEKVKTIDFSETIVVYHIKVGRCSQLNEYMKLYESQRSRSVTDLGPDISDSVLLIFLSSVTAALFKFIRLIETHYMNKIQQYFTSASLLLEKFHNMSRDMTKATKWLCAQRRLGLRCALNGYLRTQTVFMRTAKTLIRLGRCPGWSVFAGRTATLLVFVMRRLIYSVLHRKE